MKRSLLLLALAAPAALPAPARSDVLLDTFGNGQYSGSIQIGGVAGIEGNFYGASSAAPRAELLTSLSFAAAGSAPIAVTYDLGPGPDGFAASLPLGTVTPTSTPTVYTLNSFAPIAVAPGQAFYIGFTADSSRTSVVEFGTPAINAPNYYDTDGALSGPFNQAIPALRLVGSPAAVPEPAAWLLGLLAAALASIAPLRRALG